MSKRSGRVIKLVRDNYHVKLSKIVDRYSHVLFTDDFSYYDMMYLASGGDLSKFPKILKMEFGEVMGYIDYMDKLAESLYNTQMNYSTEDPVCDDNICMCTKHIDGVNGCLDENCKCKECKNG